MQSNSGNPYTAPQSHTDAPDHTLTVRPPLPLAVRCLFGLFAIGIVVFETRYAMTYVVSWRDTGHWVAAVGAICQFSYMAGTGFWTSSGRREAHTA